MASDRRQWCIMCDKDNPDSDCYWCAGTGYDLRSQDAPICPHCGAEQSTDDLHESRDIQCEKCDGWMEVELNYTVDYSTAKTDPPAEKARKRREEYERWRAAQDERMKAAEAKPNA